MKLDYWFKSIVDRSAFVYLGSDGSTSPVDEIGVVHDEAMWWHCFSLYFYFNFFLLWLFPSLLIIQLNISKIVFLFS